MARQPSVRAHQQVIDAAIQLFAERGIDNTSVDAIAERSGVSKATIYKHWADKDALCMEALFYLHGLEEEFPVFDSGDTQADLVALLEHRRAPDRVELQTRIMPHLVAYFARNQAFGDLWRTRVTEPLRASLITLLQRGIERNELARDLNMDASIAMLIGPLMYRKIFQAIHPEMPEDIPRRVAEAFWKAFGAKP